AGRRGGRRSGPSRRLMAAPQPGGGAYPCCADRLATANVSARLSGMLWSGGFSGIGIVVGDIYFVDPEPGPGQEGAERGVRLELRVFERDELRGSIYSSVPIRVGRPLWRVDLLESVT